MEEESRWPKANYVVTSVSHLLDVKSRDKDLSQIMNFNSI